MAAVMRVAWRPFAIPFREEFRAAHGSMRSREGVLVMVETASGLVGIGEASPLPSYGGGSVAEVLAALPEVGRSLLGADVAPARLASLVGGHHSAGSSAALRCGLETALASVAAEKRGEPLWRWLRAGPAAGSLAPVALRVNGTIDAGEPSAAAGEALRMVGEGFAVLKLKAGMGTDIERVRAVRNAVGDGVALRVDANGAWPAEEAVVLLARCRELGVEMVEQPIAPGAGAIGRMARLSVGVTPMSVGVDESCRSVPDVREIAATGARLVVVVKPMVTGLMEARAMVQAAEAAGVPVVITTMFDAGPGTLAAMHLAASLSGPGLAHGLATLSHLAGDVVTGVPAIVAGTLEAPLTPGLGAAIDEEAVERFATGPWCEVRS